MKQREPWPAAGRCLRKKMVRAVSEAGGDDQREGHFGSEGTFEASDGLSWGKEQEIGRRIYQAYESES